MENALFISNADILGAITLAFLIYFIKTNNFISKKKTTQYLNVAWMTLFVIMLEITTNLLASYASADTRAFAFVINIFGFSFMFSIPIAFAALYCEKVSNKLALYMIPVFIGAIMCICSIKTGWIFWIDSSGAYHRGSLFIVNSLITFYGYVVLLRAHMEAETQYDHSEQIFLSLIFLIVLGAGLTQVIFPNVQIMWGGVALSEFMYYIFLRETQFKYDTVTGVRDRNCFEETMKHTKPNKSLFLIEFDVNNLKYVNDNYGHSRGDELLNRSAQILKKAYQNCGNVYRIGGDEFAVIAEGCSEAKVRQARAQMLKLVAAAKFDYNMSFYIANAYSRFDPERHETIHDCLKETDQKMYGDKLKSKK